MILVTVLTYASAFNGKISLENQVNLFCSVGKYVMMGIRDAYEYGSTSRVLPEGDLVSRGVV